MSSLDDPRVAATLDRLHQAARGDRLRLLRFIPHFLWSAVSGKSLMKVLSPSAMKDVFIPVSRDEGRYLYVTARAARARNIVEFGASFGISTLYLAAAARDGGGRVVTTEIEPGKCRATEENLRSAGLDGHATVLEGDARRTLSAVEDPVDFLFLDGWKDLYLPVLELLLPKLRAGAVVAADNVDFSDARPFLDRVRAPGSGFTCATLRGGKMELCCRQE